MIIFSFFFSDIFKLSDSDLLKRCSVLEERLTDQDNKDRDSNDLFNEIKALKLFSLPDDTDPLSILQYIFENNLISTLPNVSISLRILLTLPVSVASGERSFSKLKIIKNYLRSTMLQERLSGLAILAIEQEIFDGINFSDVINEFATAKSRKISLQQ